MSHQSFNQYLVAAVPNLLAAGQYPTNLATGQIGIISGADNLSVTTPQFPSTKEIYLAYRLPRQADAAMAAATANPYYSQPIKGSAITGWRGFRGSMGQVAAVAVGFDGVDTTKSLSGTKVNESKRLYIRISGSPVTKAISAQGQLLVYDIPTGCQVCCPGDEECDPCAEGVQKVLAEDAVAKINGDTQNHYGWISASVLKTCDSEATYDRTTYAGYQLQISDSGDEWALALVQAQYPGYVVTRTGRTGVVSTYHMWTSDGAPAAFSTGNIPYIANCATCPTGYKSTTTSVYVVEIEDAGDSAALTAAINLFNATGVSDSVNRISYIGGVSKYVVVTEWPFEISGGNLVPGNQIQVMTANGAAGGDFTLTFNGQTTANIAHNANASAIRAALEALSNIDTGDIAVTNASTADAADTFIEFTGQYAGMNVSLLVGNLLGLTTPTGGVISQYQSATASGTINEVQKLTANAATGGTFTLTFDGQTTSNIAYNANAATIQTALNALSNVDADNIVVSGGAANAAALFFTFSGTQFAGQNVPILVVDNDLLTGGAGGTMSVSTNSKFDTNTAEGIKSIQLIAEGETICVLENATTTAWVDLSEVGYSYKKEYTITLGDTICGTDRLAELIAAYSGIGTVTVTTAGTCATKYTLVVDSNVVDAGCTPDAIVFPIPGAYQNNTWTDGGIKTSGGSDTNCKYGILIKAAAINRTTNECTYGSFTPDFDGIHIEVSEFDPNYNNKPAMCTNSWPITYLQDFKKPQNLGEQIMEKEEQSYLDVLRGYSYDAGVRAAEGFKFAAKPGVIYDVYTLEFNRSYPSGSFSETITNRHHLHVFFEAGTGKAFEAAMNAFVCGANPTLAPVVL